MNRRYTAAELRRFRNEVDIAQLIEQLGVASKHQEGYFRFLCPTCCEFNTATNPRTNLARCFRCERNFNTIDLVMVVEGVGFVDAVRRIARLAEETRGSDHPRIA